MIAGWVVLMIGAICVFTEAFFSGSEIAMVSANRALLRQKAAAGHRGAKMAESFLATPQVLLSTTLIGTNVATVTFSVVFTLWLIGEGASSGVLYTIAIVSPIILIFGEVVPKTFFQHNADALVVRLVYPLRAASLVLAPLVYLMSKFADAMMRILGADRDRAFVTRDELALLIEAEADESAPQSEITEDEREMISNLLEMSDKTVDDVMVPLSEVVALPEDATLGEAALEVADKQHTRIPIFRSRVDNIVGIVHAFDLLRRGADCKSEPVTMIARPPTFVPESKLAVDLLVELQGSGNQMAVVVDEYGGAVGIISVEDILEEIVGEIEDEYDTGPSPLRRESDGAWSATARTPVERINEELGVELPEDDEEYESIGGLLLHRMKRIPRTGEQLVIGDVTLTVLSADARAVHEIRIRVRQRGRKG